MFITQNQIPFNHHIVEPLYPLLPSPQPPFLLVTNILLSVYVVLLLFILFVYLLLSAYIPHVSEIIWFLSFSSDLFHLAKYCQEPFMLPQMAVFQFFFWLSSIPLHIHIMHSLSNHLSRDISVVSMPWLSWIRGVVLIRIQAVNKHKSWGGLL